MTKFLTSALVALSMTATAAMAQDWTLDTDTSRMAFGSVKNGYVGEVHTFEGLTGSVSRDGDVSIEIPLAGVSTNIDIRNERFAEFVFANAPTATLTAALDMAVLKKMRAGDSKTMELDATLEFLGEEVDVFTEVFVVRTSARDVMVTTNDMVMLATDELGIDASIDKLQELASLDSITRVTPVTVRFMFSR